MLPRLGTNLRLMRSPLRMAVVAPRTAFSTRMTPVTSQSKTTGERKQMSTTVDPSEMTSSQGALVPQRFQLTGEVIASKVFWAGFGWQGSSIVADKLGFSAESLAFAGTTGAGEALAVLAGHSLFYTVVKGSDASKEVPTALWLGTGTFFSGTAWQPVVNALVSLTDNFFPAVAAGTMIACGSAFYAGLRVGRALWGETLGLPVAERDYENLNSDAGLSVAIGGATAMFVACDPSAAMNVFAVPFGVLESDPNILGMIKAGGATATGYGIVQAWQNFFPRGRNWMDMYLK
eukprot:jgi/Bigna1/53668/estExt_Genewise1Plus.C_220132